MEFIQWVLQLKSLASPMIMMILGDLMIQLSQLSRDLSLNSFQVDGIRADSIILLGYLLLMASKMTAAKVKVLAAFLLCLVIVYTPIYDALSQVGYYCAFAMIYIVALRHVTNKQIKYSLAIMAIFQLFMAIDSYANPQTETWLYRNFEEVTILIHCLVVSSCVNFKSIDLGAILGRFIDSLRSLAHSQCLSTRL